MLNSLCYQGEVLVILDTYYANAVWLNTGNCCIIMWILKTALLGNFWSGLSLHEKIEMDSKY